MIGTYEVTREHTKGIMKGLVTVHTATHDVKYPPKEGTVVKRAIGGGSYKITKVVRIK